MYAVPDTFQPTKHLLGSCIVDETTSYVSFKLNERFHRLCLWINQVSRLLVGVNLPLRSILLILHVFHYNTSNYETVFCITSFFRVASAHRCETKLQNFLLPNDIESHHVEDHESIRLILTSVHDNSPVVLFFSDKEESKIITDDIDLAGDLIHSLVTFLNIEDLRVRVIFFSNKNQIEKEEKAYQNSISNLF